MFIPVLYLILCLVVAFLGRARRIGALGFFLASLILTPLIALLILVLSADNRVVLDPPADARRDR
jgi:hypothetical protein